MNRDILSAEEAAALLGVNRNVITRWCKQGVIPVHRKKNEFYFLKPELQQWRQKVMLSDRRSELDRPEGEHELIGTQNDLGVALQRGGVYRESLGDTLFPFFRNAIEKIPFLEKVDRELIHRLLVERETMATTAVGHGVALPHPRTPDLIQLEWNYVALFYHEPARTDYHALDQEPVSCSFFILANDIRNHLKLMSHLAKALHDHTFVQLLNQRVGLDGLISVLHD